MHYKTGFAVAMLAVAAASCSSKPQQAGPGGPGGGMPPTPVGLAVAQNKPIEDTTEYVATLKSLHSTNIQPQIEGQITQILVKSGDKVRQGQPLIEIDPQRQQAALSSQEAERASREANVNFAKQQAQRAQELFTAGAISQSELEQAQTAERTAEAALQSLQAQVQQQQVQLRYYTVAAPTAGVVGDVPVRVGFHVTSQTVLTTLDQNENLEVYVSVPVERSADLKPGLPVTVLSGNGQDTLAVTSITYISASVDEATQSILVKGTVPNADAKLRSMQFVRARIGWGSREGLTVPVTAVGRMNGQFYVFVAEDSGGKLVVHQRLIKVGPIAGNDYPVLDGIKPGEKIVVEGNQKLFEGSAVAEAPAGAPAGAGGRGAPPAEQK